MRDEYAASRACYMAEAALEYLIEILIGTAYLAKATIYLGMSDALTGVLTAFVSLAAAVQFAALLLVRRVPVKRWVTVLHICNQTAYAALFFIPLVPLSRRVGIVLFAGLLLSGQVIAKLINAAKLSWFMALVDNDKRGVFTANKEIVSLLAGMVFSFVMGRVIDTAEAAGDLPRAFLIMGVTIVVLMLLHTATLLAARERPAAAR